MNYSNMIIFLRVSFVLLILNIFFQANVHAYQLLDLPAHPPLDKVINLGFKLVKNDKELGGVFGKWMYPLLTEKELNELWGDIYKASRYIAPSGIMFASGVRTDGLQLMSQNKIEEGLDLAVWYLRYQKGHSNLRKIPIALKTIEKNPHALKNPQHPTNQTKKLIEKLPNKAKEKLVSIEEHLKLVNV
jgi:hypothetical protein